MTLPLRASTDRRCVPARDAIANHATNGEPLAERRAALIRGRRRAPRRGIILMMSLSLLTLFLMMLVTLIVITGQYRQSARVQARVDRVGDPPHKITDLAIKNVLVGSGTGASVVDGHGLMIDLYGGSWRGVLGVTPVVDTLANPRGVFVAAPAAEPLRFNPGSAPSFVTFEFRRVVPTSVDPSGYLNLFTNTTAGDYTGCILTFTGGPVRKNVSVRILEYVPPTNSAAPDCFVGRFTVARSNPDETDTLPDAATLSAAVVSGGQVSFVVNERPFSGYGAGYGPVPDPDTSTPPNGVGLWGYNISQEVPYVSEWSGGTPYGLPAALLPNYQFLGTSVPGYDIASGGLNEDYDAVDYQNMFLASVPPRAQRADQIVPSFWRPELINYWRHFQDPNDNTKYPWYQNASNTTFARYRNDFYRAICLRPLPTDHPEFSGSNADWAMVDITQPLPLLTGSNDTNEDGIPDEPLAPSATWPPMSPNSATPLVDALSDLNGNGIVDQWDVDNDGDGLTDSIWIDIGLPVQRMEDGKLYKPLVAYLIRDLDGLANVNAHLHPDFAAAQQSNITGPLAGTAGGNRPRGMGYGPAEIAFPATGFGAPSASYNAPLFTNAQVGQLLAGRYGYLGVDERPGRPGVNDLISRLRSPTLPPGVYNATTISEWGTPPDAWGTQAIGLDYLGHPYNDHIGLTAQVQTHMSAPAPPFTAVASPAGPTEGSDDPYEIDLYSAHAGAVDATLGYLSPDAPYTLAELERILRWNDSDAAYLPNRLAQAVDPAFNDPDAAAALARRRAVTTHSSYIPAAPSAVPSERRVSDATVTGTAPQLGSPKKWSLYHLYSQKLIANANSLTGAPFNGTNHATPNWDPANVGHRAWVDNEVRKMMPWESWHGMKMDLNRRWQNGFDDDNDGIVDEPDEVNVPETVFPNQAWTSAYGLGQLATYNQQFDHLGADPQFAATGSSNAVARQIYARHLYCTALLLIDYDHDGPDAMTGTLDGFDPRTAFEDTELTSDWNRANEIFKRRLAQWAINVVDYRDSDAICTPFEYDMNPANGWQANIDGDPGTVELGERRIVWGVEAPHLLISETLALHNRRVIDSNRDDGNQRTRSSMPTPDPDLDQHRIPQGSLFVELFGVGNRVANDAHVPRELYAADGRLEVDKTAPGGAGVWRLAISESHEDDDTTAYRRAEDNVRPDSTSFDPQDLNLLTLTNPALDSGGEEVVIPTYPATVDPTRDHRYVYFTSGLPPAGAGADQSNTFYRRNAGPTRVNPGGYLVVAPRPVTHMSLTNDDDDATRPVEGQARIAVNGTGLENYGNFDDLGAHQHPDPSAFGTQIAAPQAVICAADPPSTWSTVTTPIGLNISEPLPQSAAYYTEPTHGVISDGVLDGYAPWNDAAVTTLPNRPFDYQPGTPLEGMLNVGTETTPNWRTVFLQRLANPLEPFHATQNPYITVDFAPLGITVFNGDDRHPSPYSGPDPWDPQDVNHDGPDDFGGAFEFGSFERGPGNARTETGTAWQSYYPVTNPADFDSDDFLLWPHRVAEPPVTTASAPGGVGVLNETEFRHNLVHTLGYLNVTWGMDPAVVGYLPPRPDYLGAPPSLPAGGGGTSYSFPWLNWADRPFASPYELLTVPHSSQASWFANWSKDEIATNPTLNPYQPGAAVPESLANYRGYFKHLWNFFHRPLNRRSPTVTAQSPQMARLFDYVETPSPFAGSQEFFSTGNMNLAPGFLRAGNSELSRFRDPGRVNLNTMPHVLWDSFNYGHGSLTPNNRQFRPTDSPSPGDPGEFAITRRGFDPSRPTWHYPTRIAKPYRSAGKADLAPLLPGADPERLRQFDVNATLLRSDEFAAAPAPQPQPLFAGPRHGEQFQSTHKNPYFRYEQLARLPNLTSTQSNVYAVWVTVGYFEAHKTSPTTRGYANYAGQPLPDGVWLGQEIGADTGRNRRHRGFYIIDRSVPAAFEPGNDHNVEKTILLRRYLD